MSVGFGFSSVTFRPCRVFHSRVFSRPSLTRMKRVGLLEVARILPNIQKVVTKYSCRQLMCLYAFISLLYKQLLQYTPLKAFNVTSALLTKNTKMFHTKFLASTFISQNCPRKHFALTPPCFICVSRAIAKHVSIGLTAFYQCSRLVD